MKTFYRISALAAALLLDPVMQPVLDSQGLQESLQRDFVPEMRSEAERLITARVAVIKLLNAKDEFAAFWSPLLFAGATDEGYDPDQCDVSAEAIVNACKSLGQVSVLNADLVGFHLNHIAGIDSRHPLAQHWRLFREACTPIDGKAPDGADWKALQARNLPPPMPPEPEMAEATAKEASGVVVDGPAIEA